MESVVAVLVLVVVLLAIVRRNRRVRESFESFFFLQPTLWWFVDTEHNSRNWWDFGARSSMEPNRGYLQVSLEAVRRTQREFRIVPLIGREAVLSLLGVTDPSVKQLPPALWRDYAIANILAKKGGLVMDGNSTLCVGPSLYPQVSSIGAAMFGVNPDEPVYTHVQSPGPAPYVGWASSPNHPAWVYSANVWNRLVASGPQAWSSAEARRTNQTVWEKQSSLGCVLLRDVDGGRLPNGKLRQLEDLFGRVATPSDPNMSIMPGTVYVSYNGDDLARRYEFNWFLRLSKKQIQESDFVWSRLANSSMVDSRMGSFTM